MPADSFEFAGSNSCKGQERPQAREVFRRATAPNFYFDVVGRLNWYQQPAGHWRVPEGGDACGNEYLLVLGVPCVPFGGIRSWQETFIWKLKLLVQIQRTCLYSWHSSSAQSSLHPLAVMAKVSESHAFVGTANMVNCSRWSNVQKYKFVMRCCRLPLLLLTLASLPTHPCPGTQVAGFGWVGRLRSSCPPRCQGWAPGAPRWAGRILSSIYSCPPMFCIQFKGMGGRVAVSHPSTDRSQHCLTSVNKTFGASNVPRRLIQYV